MLYNMHETLIFVCLVYNAFLNLGITGYSFSRGVWTPQPPSRSAHALCLIFNRNPIYFFCQVKRHFTSCNVTILNSENCSIDRNIQLDKPHLYLDLNKRIVHINSCFFALHLWLSAVKSTQLNIDPSNRFAFGWMNTYATTWIDIH